MYKNYENRVKDFVIDMTNPHSIVKHKDVTEKITNTRVELMNELFEKNPEKKKPLVFRGYTTEADRIKDTIKNYHYLYYLPDYEKIKSERKKLKMSNSPNKTISTNLNYSSLEKKNSIDKNKNNVINTNNKDNPPLQTITSNDSIKNKILEKQKSFGISQPTMRYKPRTDLERVYDVLNTYHCDEKPKEIIERQLKSINLYEYQRQRDSINSLGKIENDDKKRHSSKILLPRSVRKKHPKIDLYKKSKIYYNPKKEEPKPWQRREDLNNEAYGLLSSYHYKTHFKAAEEIAESNYKNSKNNSVFLLPNLLPKYFKPKSIKKNVESEEKEDPFKFGEDENSLVESEDYEEFDQNYNPIIKKKKSIIDPEKMKILTKIAFKQKKSGFENFNLKNEEEENQILQKMKNKKGNKNYAEDNNVFIKDKIYFKNSQFDKITSEILEMCKVYSTKSKFNNTVHKSKGGKTMITQGMTVGEFEKKYKLQE